MTSLKIGDEVSVPIDPLGLTNHRGLCIDFDFFSGEPTVAHNSWEHGHAKEELLSDFSDGKKITIRKRETKFTAKQIQKRARQRLGTPYKLTSTNCEDFISDVLGLNEGSPQRMFWGIVMGAGFIYFMVKSRPA